ncbi:hypothetical protein SBY92_000027 [Candida maltosa Xu316]|uniref:Uncharacterized protein n=1 Tax=Candida maltosa (strain Xu316) TaxID=1245528 RepID=M3JXM1_CANMX|nr:hypothetical protein G210_2553 [Candida maltosa Xu316]
MFARSSRSYSRLVFKRLQHTAHASTSEAVPFVNKFGFDLSPPPVHEYWNFYNSSVLFAFVPVFIGMAYGIKFLGVSGDASDAYLRYANDEASSVMKLPFGQPQLPPKKDE